MKTYSAVDKNGLSIISVGADTLDEARVEIKNQLDRPGRSEFLPRWILTMRRLRPSDLPIAENGSWSVHGIPIETDLVVSELQAGHDVLVDN